jgi:tellurite resistance protein TerC
MSTSRTLLSLRVMKRIVVTLIGGSILIIGVALLVLPGPAFIVIPIGLALLATEYAWAKRWLRRAQEYAAQLTSNKSH